MLQPKITKYRKHQRRKRRGYATKGNTISVGEYALQATGRNWVNAQQIEAARKAIVRTMKRKGKVWLRIFPDKPMTKKAEGVRMGSGKGNVEGYVAVVKPGRIIFELSGVTQETAKEAFRLAGFKLPLRTKFIVKQ